MSIVISSIVIFSSAFLVFIIVHILIFFAAVFLMLVPGLITR